MLISDAKRYHLCIKISCLTLESTFKALEYLERDSKMASYLSFFSHFYIFFLFFLIFKWNPKSKNSSHSNCISVLSGVAVGLFSLWILLFSV